MEIYIDQPVSIADRAIKISVSGLPPNERLTLRATMCFPWAESVVFGSTAEYTADSDGCVDLTKHAPISGDYQGIDGMGFITSMRLISGDTNTAWANISVDKGISIDIVVECATETATARIERLFLSPETKTEEISEPFVGTFYYSDNPDNKAVLMLGGSSGELGNILPVASVLAAHGCNVLAVAYFKEPGLPKELVDIPLEYFDPVFNWLSANPYTKGKDIYLHCTSKGSELGLLLASMHHEIKRVAAYAPHAYCFQGISFTKHASSWTYQNRELPYIRLQFRTLYANVIGCFIKDRPFGYTHTHVAGLRRARNKEDARIRVTDAKADLLMFSGKQCNMWNTYDGCVEIMDTLDKSGYPYRYDHIAYENTGEPFYAPYIIPERLRLSVKVAPRLSLSMGGTLQGNTEAVIDSWEKMLQFFETAV